MKLLSGLAAFAALCQYARAHYFFPYLIVNKTLTPEWKYVRDKAGDPGYAGVPGEFAKASPQYDIYSEDITCGRSAFASAANTETADVLAGDEIGFNININVTSAYTTIAHLGPAQIYLAEAPNGDLSTFSGIEGNWFKIASFTARDDANWYSTGLTSINFTIPATTPPGKYLVRIEHFMPTSQFNYNQWYVNCAQVNIIGPGGGKPETAGFAKFPGTYNLDDPGIWVPAKMDHFDPTSGLLGYVAPGPAVWKG